MYDDQLVEKWTVYLDELLHRYSGTDEELLEEIIQLYSYSNHYIESKLSRDELIIYYDRIDERLWDWDIEFEWLIGELEYKIQSSRHLY